MMATWVQAWRLSSLKTRLAAILQNTQSPVPSIVFYSNPSSCIKQGIQKKISNDTYWNRTELR